VIQAFFCQTWHTQTATIFSTATLPQGGLITDPPDLSRSDQIRSDLIRIRSEFLWSQMAVIGPFF
jgi:hypothetical protein